MLQIFVMSQSIAADDVKSLFFLRLVVLETGSPFFMCIRVVEGLC